MKDKKKKVVLIAEVIIKTITGFAVMGALISVCSMVEAWSFSSTALSVLYTCLVWFGILGLYLHLINR